MEAYYSRSRCTNSRGTNKKINMEPTNQQNPPNPSRIMQIGMGFWASKTLLAAVKFKLFTLLAGKKMSAAEIKTALKLQTTDRHVYDWLDALTTLGFLQREGMG